MTLLSKISSPLLKPEILAALIGLKILTVEDLLLGKNRNQAYQVLDEIIYHLEEEFSAPLLNAFVIYQQILDGSNRGKIISTGSNTLDDLLGGGLFTGDITEVSGLYSTGKTQLCMSAALQGILHPLGSGSDTYTPQLGRVWYIDSNSSFSPRRILQMFSSNLSGSDTKASEANPTLKIEASLEILNHIQYFDIRNVFDLLNVLQQLKLLLNNYHSPVPHENSSIPHLSQEQSELVSGLSLVIIDSLGLLIGQEVTSKLPFGRSLMMEVAQLMKSLAVQYQIAFLVTNYTTNEVLEDANPTEPHLQTIQTPALGKNWAHVPNVQLMLKYPLTDEELEQGGRIAELLKSNHTQASKRAKFTITHRGIDEPLGGGDVFF